MPPTPCTAKTSSESSILSRCLMKSVAKKQTAPPATPIAIAPIGPTKPEAGVMVASPATQPVTMPTEVGLPTRTHSIAIQVSAAAARREMRREDRRRRRSRRRRARCRR